MEPKLSLVEAQEVVATKPYPGVSKEGIEAKIGGVRYILDGHLTVCIITMRNGFMVLGKSAPADIRNYDKDVGERYAYDDAFKPLWQLEGYLLRERMTHSSNPEVSAA
jgi:hypothetical protein